MATKKTKYVKLIEKKKAYRSIYYGAIQHQDENSITFIGTCAEEKMSIITLAIEDYYVEEIPRNLFEAITEKVSMYRNRKLDSAQFDLDDECKKTENTNNLILEALK